MPSSRMTTRGKCVSSAFCVSVWSGLWNAGGKSSKRDPSLLLRQCPSPLLKVGQAAIKIQYCNTLPKDLCSGQIHWS